MSYDRRQPETYRPRTGNMSFETTNKSTYKPFHFEVVTGTEDSLSDARTSTPIPSNARFEGRSSYNANYVDYKPPKPERYRVKDSSMLREALAYEESESTYRKAFRRSRTADRSIRVKTNYSSRVLP
jgi:hypothetical protein